MKEQSVSLKTRINGVPSEVQVIPYGRHETEKGVFVLDGESMSKVVEEFNSRRNDMVIDYEHQTLSGAEAPAAGWIKGLINKGSDGIWASVEWTPRALRYLRGREYRYLSPVFVKRALDNMVVRLVNTALTNQPAIDGMVPVVNKEKDSGSQGAEGSSNSLELSNPRVFESLKKRKEVAMKKLFEALGLREDIGEEQTLKAVEAMKLENEALKARSAAAAKVVEALGLDKGATPSEVLGTIEAMKQGSAQAEALGRKAAELEARLREGEAGELVAQAMKEGKITPSQKDWAREYAERDPGGFRTFVARSPVVVPTGEVAGMGVRQAVGADGLQLSVNKALGIDNETFRRHNKSS
jgi:phage I-like protein